MKIKDKGVIILLQEKVPNSERYHFCYMITYNTW